eukprot:CAMPEP_0194108132 /NCGR_PEP_ID=MMETSP0150-20130528/7885_1 /TAXON_ID=122233 /ORGANISM="Chaetoceros debilis, Strain MM31A-1" /LENGTH=114 /DNA_ID=CAMNT_0038796751 /DNA_START=180 /DNA_END=525 /DNA_ORIENTATION=+
MTSVGMFTEIMIATGPDIGIIQWTYSSRNLSDIALAHALTLPPSPLPSLLTLSSLCNIDIGHWPDVLVGCVLFVSPPRLCKIGHLPEPDGDGDADILPLALPLARGIELDFAWV